MVARQNVIHQQTGNTSITILKGVDANIAIVEDGSQFDGRHLGFLFFVVVPLDQIGHQSRRLLRRSVLETFSGNCDYGIGARLIHSRMDNIGGSRTIRRLAVHGIIFTEQGVMQLPNESLCKRMLLVGSFRLYHF